MEEEQTQMEEQVQEQAQETVESPVTVMDDGNLRVDFSKLRELENQETETETVVNVADEDSEQEEQHEEEVQEQHEEHQIPTVSDEQILEYFKGKGKNINSLEELFQQNNEAQTPELDSEVSAFQKYKSETGRGLEDYIKLNQDVNLVPEDELIFGHYKKKYPYASEDEINQLITFDLTVDEYSDNERDVLQKGMLRKEIVNNERTLLQAEKEKYGTRVESTNGMSEQDLAEFNEWKQDRQYTQEQEQQFSAVRDNFVRKTNEYFDNKFDGFEYKIGEDKVLKYKVEDVNAIKNRQSDLNNFFKKFLDENNMLKDASEYHRSLAIANNPDNFAKYFYEQGRAQALEEFEKGYKNIDMRRTPQTPNTNVPKYRIVESSSQSEYKIKNRQQ